MRLTRAQSRWIDGAAMQRLHIPGIVLMENAARGIAECILRIPEARQGPIAILCGPGNNGGDGFACARHLLIAGCAVRVLALADHDAGDAATNRRILEGMHVPIRGEMELEGAVLLVDALFGTGLQRPLEGRYRTAVEAINAHPATVVAVDIPSGLDADSGAVLGAAVRARWTATMVAPKVGFTRGAGPDHVGNVEVVGIGIPPSLIREAAARETA